MALSIVLLQKTYLYTSLSSNKSRQQFPPLKMAPDPVWQPATNSEHFGTNAYCNYISGVIEFNPAPQSDEVIVKYFIEHLFQQDEYCFGNCTEFNMLVRSN